MNLSIIIPIYNVEKYLSDCLNSVINQKKSDLTYEIIIVNDGTPDNSLKIAEDYAKSHNNITIISQENQGLGGARNTGLKAASGDYVWFIDSDDWINLNSLLILEPFLKLQLDAITFGAADFINNITTVQ